MATLVDFKLTHMISMYFDVSNVTIGSYCRIYTNNPFYIDHIPLEIIGKHFQAPSTDFLNHISFIKVLMYRMVNCIIQSHY